VAQCGRVLSSSGDLNTGGFQTAANGSIYSLQVASYRVASCESSEMQWIRRNSGFCSGAALLALAIQFVVSFGHVHLQGLQGSSLVVAIQLQPQANGAGSTGPADDDQGTNRHDFCAICIALSLTSNSALPTISSLTIPVDQPHKWIADFRTTQVSFGLHFHFQARAPPRTV